MTLSTHGFTLLEVLIAMILFSIGMLGLAGMQGIALKDNNDAYLRSKAIFLAYDMGDRIRANPTFWRQQVTQHPASVAAGTALLLASKNSVHAYNNTSYPFCSTDDKPNGTPAATEASFCTAKKLAQYDWYRVRSEIIETLPNGSITVTNQNDPDSGEKIIRLLISWNMTNTSVSNIAPSFTFDVRP